MKLLWLASLLAVASPQKARFHNYQLRRVTPENGRHVAALQDLSGTHEYIFLTFPTKVGRPVDVVVPPHKLPDFQDFVDRHALPQVVRMENYQRLLDEEEKLLNARPKRMEWTSYHDLEEIYDWLDDLSRNHSFVKTVVGGKTFEGREIRGIEITFGRNLPGVFIESGIHACEWIAPAGTSWMINEILKSPEDSVFRNFNYIYFPVFNPDGYVYSWTKYRLWRKTRTPYRGSGRTCYGADLNRNWDFHWNGEGTTSDPCAGNYAGPRAFSETEAKSLAEFVAANVRAKRVDVYLAFHSYYQMLLYPWGHSPDPAPLDRLWKRIGDAAASDMAAVHGTEFQVGQGYHVIWPISGGSGEWVYGRLNTTLTFLFEMRDTGEFGFVLPAKNIIPVGEEHLPGLRRILAEYRKLNVSKFSLE